MNMSLKLIDLTLVYNVEKKIFAFRGFKNILTILEDLFITISVLNVQKNFRITKIIGNMWMIFIRDVGNLDVTIVKWFLIPFKMLENIV